MTQLTDRDREVLAVLGPEPTSVSDLFRALGGDGIPTRTQRRHIAERLEKIEGRIGVESVTVGPANQAQRWWRRTGSATISTSDALRAKFAVGICQHNAKFGYESEEVAVAAIREIACKSHHARYRPRRAYECPWCRLWHLTSTANAQRPAG